MSPAPRRSILLLAVRGVAWTIGTGVGSRVLGLVGTLVITYFVARDALGEVSDASIIVLLANQFSTLGVGQYYVSRPSVGRDVAWHATVAHVSLGLVSLVALFALEHPLSVWMKAPALGRYLPGFAFAGVLDRVAYMPERVLARRMEFRRIGLCRSAGEISYTVASLGFAAAGWGGMAIVVANVARSLARLVTMTAGLPLADWASPGRIEWKTLRSMLRFGVPVSIGGAAGFTSRRIDNVIISSLFGTEVLGGYNLAYNVADVPAVQIGEQIGDVLLPSYAHLSPEDRKAALVRSTGLLALVTFPLAVGLGAVAQTVVDALLRPEWRDVGPMLAVLSCLSVVRPVGWTISSYLLARDQPRLDAKLEVFKLAALVALLLTLGRLGPVWACVAVGVAFGAHALASMVAVQLLDGVRARTLAVQCAPALAACVPMLAAVMAVQALESWGGMHTAAARLVLEISVGAATYPVAALFLARAQALDLLMLARRLLSHQRPSSTESTVSSSDMLGANPRT
ncbi:MAG TPA: oligosaccharide flippase family protein [Polyangiaceae bacterium]